MQAFRLGSLYFLVVFVVGISIKSIRELSVLPEIGERAADLVEAPLMFVVIFLVAAWIVRGSLKDPSNRNCIPIGLTALGLTLLAGWLLDFGPTGIRPQEYLKAEDRTTPVIFLGGLAFLTVAPCVLRQILIRNSQVTDPL